MTLPVKQMGMTLAPFDQPLPVLRIQPSLAQGIKTMPDSLVKLPTLPATTGIQERWLQLMMDPQLDMLGMQALMDRYGHQAMAGMSMNHGAMGGGDMKGMDHGNMKGMEKGGMQGMDHGNMKGMDHGSMAGMDHGGAQGKAKPFDFSHGNMINGKAFDMTKPMFAAKRGQYEKWTISGEGDMMLHPFHIHGTQFRILSENGKPPAASQRLEGHGARRRVAQRSAGALRPSGQQRTCVHGPLPPAGARRYRHDDGLHRRRMIAARRSGGGALASPPAKGYAKLCAFLPATDLNTMKHTVDVMISEQEVKTRIAELGRQITEHYRDSGSDMVLVGLLRGSFMFMADLCRAIDVPHEVDFMTASSYGSGMSTTRDVKILKDLDEDIRGKDVLIVEDIIDSGNTLNKVREILALRGPKSLAICTLLDKPERREVQVPVEYVGFSIPDEFVVGYGIDYAQRYRHLPYVGKVVLLDE